MIIYCVANVFIKSIPSNSIHAGVCPDLTPPTSGAVSYNPVGSRLLNTVATYRCNTGYVLTGGTTTRTCQSDRTWSGSEPTCQGTDVLLQYATSNVCMCAHAFAEPQTGLYLSVQVFSVVHLPPLPMDLLVLQQ